MNRFYVYEYMRRHDGASDYELVKNFGDLTSEEIWEGKCLYYDYLIDIGVLPPWQEQK